MTSRATASTAPRPELALETRDSAGTDRWKVFRVARSPSGWLAPAGEPGLPAPLRLRSEAFGSWDAPVFTRAPLDAFTAFVTAEHGGILQARPFQRSPLGALVGRLYPDFVTYVLTGQAECQFIAPLQMATTKPGTFPIENELHLTDLETTTRVSLARHMADAFAAATLEDFEAGVESHFARTLSNLVQGHGDAALATLRPLLASDISNLEVVSEALQALGRVEHEASKKGRLALLQEFLRSKVGRTRYAAALGLAAMDDSEALEAIRQAADQEEDATLRRYLELMLEQITEA